MRGCTRCMTSVSVTASASDADSAAPSARNSSSEKCARRISALSDTGGPVCTPSGPRASTRSQNDES